MTPAMQQWSSEKQFSSPRRSLSPAMAMEAMKALSLAASSSTSPPSFELVLLFQLNKVIGPELGERRRRRRKKKKKT
jgi:hypothetical protein